jgi:predicted DNA-binding antitoxin AbrB/MazE fold protein
MATISITVIYENGVLRPTEKIDLSERGVYRVIVVPVEERRQQSLADVLGFDPSDVQVMQALIENQQQALRAFIGTATTEEPDDASTHHDKYLYGLDP